LLESAEAKEEAASLFISSVLDILYAVLFALLLDWRRWSQVPMVKDGEELLRQWGKNTTVANLAATHVKVLGSDLEAGALPCR
jgi:hypothetical protein